MLHVDDSMLKDIGRGFSIPAQPELLLKLQKITAEQDPNINALADVIAQDIAVSSTILKTINSPLYGLSRSISDIKKSVRYIGLKGTVTLVTSSLIRNSFSQDGCGITLEEFWQKASNIANACVFIGKKIKKGGSPEKLFTLGLFHDCGIPVMAMKYKDYQDILDQAVNTPSIPLTQIEEKAYGVNHATIGYYVASSWRLPKDMCQLILQHHDRNYLLKLDRSEQQTNFAIIKLAENIVHLHKHFRESADWQYLHDTVLTALDLDDEDVQDFIEDLQDELV